MWLKITQSPSTHDHCLECFPFMKTHKGISHLRSEMAYLFLFWARKGRIKLTFSYHSICLPVFEEKQDYSISPTQKRQTVWIPLFHRAPIGINCFLCIVFTIDSYGFGFIIWQYFANQNYAKLNLFPSWV